MLSSVPGGLPYPHFGPRGYLVGRMQRWRRPLKQQLSAAATCGCSLPPLLSRRSGSGLFMASAHVQTIPGELLKQTALAGQPQLLPELSNFYCYPGRAGGSPWVISVAHHPYSCAARVEARPRRVGGRTARFWKDCRRSLQPRLRIRIVNSGTLTFPRKSGHRVTRILPLPVRG